MSSKLVDYSDAGREDANQTSSSESEEGFHDLGKQRDEGRSSTGIEGTQAYSYGKSEGDIERFREEREQQESEGRKEGSESKERVPGVKKDDSSISGMSAKAQEKLSEVKGKVQPAAESAIERAKPAAASLAEGATASGAGRVLPGGIMTAGGDWSLHALGTWRNPVRSALVFGACTFFWYIITVREWNIVSLLAFVGLAMQAVAFITVHGFKFYGKFVKGNAEEEDPITAHLKNRTFSIDKQTVDPWVEKALASVNNVLGGVRNLVLSRDTGLLMKVTGTLYGLYMFASIFSLITWAYILVLYVFVWTKVYQLQKERIDEGVRFAMGIFRKNLNTLQQKIPPSVTARLPFLKPKSR